MVGVLEKWAQHRTTDHADDNVAQWGSIVIQYTARGDPDSKARWLAAGAEGVLRGIVTSESAASMTAKSWTTDTLKNGLGLQA